jgi:pimeloyl-ACP methyl ester carboxylesterase
MVMATQLDPEGGFVETGGVLIATPGVGGQAEAVHPSPGDSRADAHVSEVVAAALTAADLQVQVDIELSDLAVGAGGAAGRGGGESEPMILAQVPSPGESMSQVVLLVDEDGLLTWHYPAEQTVGDRTRGDELLTYRIPLRTAAGGGEDTRGPLGWLGKKVLKVLVFRHLDELLGRAGRYLAGRWEEKHRWYGLRTVTGTTGLAGEPVDWAGLTAGPALLLVHGTFSRGATAFSALPADELRRLCDTYGDRVVVFDHPTVSVDPLTNARWFAEQFSAGAPDNASLVVDVVAHSRGGLVARALAEQQDRLPLGDRRLEVRSAVFVGVPNAGTVLADTEHLGDLLDTYTNLLDAFPDIGAVDVLQVVLEVVKQVATGVAEGLDGLMSMNPGGNYLRALNKEPSEQTRYAAIAADFAPASRDARHLAMDLIADRLFRVANDLVVPRDGGWEVDDQALVPAGRRLSIADEQAVTHNSYFGSSAVQARLREWLTGS